MVVKCKKCRRAKILMLFTGPYGSGSPEYICDNPKCSSTIRLYVD